MTARDALRRREDAKHALESAAPLIAGRALREAATSMEDSTSRDWDFQYAEALRRFAVKARPTSSAEEVGPIT